MSSLGVFLKANEAKEENLKIVVSKRYSTPLLDEKGKPILDEEGNPKVEHAVWEFRKLTSKENKQIRQSCFKEVRTGKRGQQKERELDTELYLSKMITTSCVFPNLYAKELWEDRGVMSPEDLLESLLTAGEYDNLAIRIKDFQGYDEPIEEKKEEAKN